MCSIPAQLGTYTIVIDILPNSEKAKQKRARRRFDKRLLYTNEPSGINTGIVSQAYGFGCSF